MSKITVIISAHKERGFLESAIRSAMTQTFTDYEIILSSDGNPDLKRYATKYGLKFCLTEKKSHSSALNHAVKIASGEWIKEVHDDDLLEPNCLKDLYNGRAEADLIYANATNFTLHSPTILKIWTHRPPVTITLIDLLPVTRCLINGATIFYKRDAFLKVGGFDPDLHYSEEYEFYLNLLTHGYKFKYVNSFVARYRVHHDQQSTSLNQQQREMNMHIVKKLRGYIEETKINIPCDLSTLEGQVTYIQITPKEIRQQIKNNEFH